MLGVEAAEPTVQFAQPGVVGREFPDLFVGAKDRARELGEAREVGAAVGGGDERDAAGPIGDLSPAGDPEAHGMTQELLGDDAAQAVGDEEERPLADPLGLEQVQDLGAAVGECHRLGLPPRGVRRVAQGPDAEPRPVLRQPVRPEGLQVVRVDHPGGEGVSPQAVDQNQVQVALGIGAAGDGQEALAVLGQALQWHRRSLAGTGTEGRWFRLGILTGLGLGKELAEPIRLFLAGINLPAFGDEELEVDERAGFQCGLVGKEGDRFFGTVGVGASECLTLGFSRDWTC